MSTDKIFADLLQCKILGIGQESPQDCGCNPFLEMDTIHLWSARYEDIDGCFRQLSDVNSLKERKTAAGFRKSADARKYTLRQGIVRIILAHYIHCEPEMITLVTGKNGKPEPGPDSASAGLRFNLSHTGEMVLIGVTKGRRIGVDMVKMDPAYRFQDTAEYMLVPAEKGFLDRTEQARRYEVFFRLWAAKEAVIKVTGGTLAQMGTLDLSGCIEEIMCSPDFSMVSPDTQPPFFLWQFTNGSGHLGAISVDADSTP
jgi:4'-phosphopantetheinyl transferase